MRPLVVLGDALLDVDVEGSATRLCPEAPVPVVDVEGEWVRPGGAGLAAMLLATRTTPDVVLVTALGADTTGRRLASLLARDVEVLRLPLDGETPRKTRVRASGQSLTRLDTGRGRAAEAPLPARVRHAVDGAGAVLVSDYGSGVTAHPELRRLLTELTTHVPVVWDPHPLGPPPVPGATLVTPNEREALAVAEGCVDVADAAEAVRRGWGCRATAVTLGAEGAVLATPDSAEPIPVPVPDGAFLGAQQLDTCGAGDRFASAAVAALAEGADVTDAVVTAVDTASRFVAAGGASALSVHYADRRDGPEGTHFPGRSAFEFGEHVRRRGDRLVATGGCFDLLHAGHVSLLKQARALGDALVVCVNSDESVRRLKGPGRPVVPAADRARLLAELSCVDAVVVFEESTPSAVLERLRPDVWVKGGDYADDELPEAEVVRRHGGEVVLVPTLDGCSTTRLLQEALRRPRATVHDGRGWAPGTIGSKEAR
ncbi:D-glycero-beta-D-manno-heptose 1-phosphate adenylyltransferase [Saccharomonospora viridis]|uniref:D-glycero-beta-D-manno-heptose 1-phosphate adenylyltransferase n=1 Tax=Saccharomonospora viridis TaxID=1852 RepID=UPI0024098494|nr:D-glycero-beta-D-manno-heptose 1-phosphate adenylyltransferase [Saccharomonospora viridis]